MNAYTRGHLAFRNCVKWTKWLAVSQLHSFQMASICPAAAEFPRVSLHHIEVQACREIFLDEFRSRGELWGGAVKMT